MRRQATRGRGFSPCGGKQGVGLRRRQVWGGRKEGGAPIPICSTDLVPGLNVGAEGEKQGDLLEVSARGSVDELLGRLGLQPLK